MVHANCPEKRKTRRKLVNRNAGFDAGSQIFKSVGQRVCHFDIGRSTGFLHVISADGNAVELGHKLRRVFEDIGNDFHRRHRRINVRVPHHEFLQNVVLNGSGQLFGFHALFFGCNNVEGHHGQYCTVHGHRHRHFAQRNLIEQNFHIFHRIDCHTGFSDITKHALVVAVVTSVCCQVERY
ncbi:hypothetical protein SDC9_52431 [bioreactor metagenome]|uniref:Uncharacterized protein n=1 Tax=bioreactor metagenome TaxID=1076179 RepID=A0A644WQH6_9ZZZZ